MFPGIAGIGLEFAEYRLEDKPDHAWNLERSARKHWSCASDLENFKVLAKSP
jgi:hypothetical protein